MVALVTGKTNVPEVSPPSAWTLTCSMSTSFSFSSSATKPAMGSSVAVAMERLKTVMTVKNS